MIRVPKIQCLDFSARKTQLIGFKKFSREVPISLSAHCQSEFATEIPFQNLARISDLNCLIKYCSESLAHIFVSDSDCPLKFRFDPMKFIQFRSNVRTFENLPKIGVTNNWLFSVSIIHINKC